MRNAFTLLYCGFLVFYFSNLHAQFTLIHISDLHVADGNPAGYIGNYDLNGSVFRCCMKNFKGLYPKPAFIAASGDISNVGDIPSDGMYSALTRHLYPHPYSYPRPGDYFIDLDQDIPIYFAPGNHEYFQSIVPPIFLSAPTYYEENVSPDEDYTVTKDNAVILFLRSGYDRPFWEGVNPFEAKANGLTDDQCRWLRETLGAAGNKRKIIVMHHPVKNNSGINYSDSAHHAVPADEGTFENNRSTFINICDSYHVDVVLIGHTHHNVVLNKGGYIVDENWTGGTRYVQTAHAYGGNYRIITVGSSFVSVGNPLQVDCSAPGEKNDMNTFVALNPNPITSLASLELRTGENIIDYEMRIYSLQGVEVKRITGINSTTTIIDKGNLLPGIYFYSVYNDQGLVKGSGKMNIMNK